MSDRPDDSAAQERSLRERTVVSAASASEDRTDATLPRAGYDQLAPSLPAQPTPTHAAGPRPTPPPPAGLPRAPSLPAARGDATARETILRAVELACRLLEREALTPLDGVVIAGAVQMLETLSAQLRERLDSGDDAGGASLLDSPAPPGRRRKPSSARRSSRAKPGSS
jgi:hypothetical protein